MTFDKCRWMHLFLRQQVFWRRVIRLLVTRKLYLGCWDVHFVASQDAVGILLGPQVVVLRGGFLGSAWLDPTHFYGMDQLPDLTERDGCSDGTVERKTHTVTHHCRDWEHMCTIITQNTRCTRRQFTALNTLYIVTGISRNSLFFYWNICRSDFFQRSVSDPHYAGVLDLFPL